MTAPTQRPTSFSIVVQQVALPNGSGRPLLLLACGCQLARALDLHHHIATAAAVQNLLLAATANGLASYWASISDHFHAPARAVAGVDDSHDFVALVYLGHPTGAVAAPTRPAPEITWLT